MKFIPGQIIELSAAGHKTFDGGSSSGKNRTSGKIIGRSVKYPNCCRVKWKSRKVAETLHEKFIQLIAK